MILQDDQQQALDSVLDRLVETAQPRQQSEAKIDFRAWLRIYAQRTLEDKEAWAAKTESASKSGQSAGWETTRSAAMRKVNPRFVLRQWVLEELIGKLEHGPLDVSPQEALGRIMDVSRYLTLCNYI